MVNVWNYHCGQKAKVKTNDGKLYDGVIIELCEAEDDGLPEDSLTIETPNGIFGIMPSEIQTVEIYDTTKELATA